MRKNESPQMQTVQVNRPMRKMNSLLIYTIIENKIYK